MSEKAAKKKTFQSVLKEYGFKKMPWNKCPQGFEKSNYPCYSHKEKNVWVELYLSDKPSYGWIISPDLKPRGKFFESPKELEKIINSLPTKDQSIKQG